MLAFKNRFALSSQYLAWQLRNQMDWARRKEKWNCQRGKKAGNENSYSDKACLIIGGNIQLDALRCFHVKTVWGNEETPKIIWFSMEIPLLDAISMKAIIFQEGLGVFVFGITDVIHCLSHRFIYSFFVSFFSCVCVCEPAFHFLQISFLSFMFHCCFYKTFGR